MSAAGHSPKRPDGLTEWGPYADDRVKRMIRALAEGFHGRYSSHGATAWDHDELIGAENGLTRMLELVASGDDDLAQMIRWGRDASE